MKYYSTCKEARKVAKSVKGRVHYHPKKRLYYVKKIVIKGWLEL